MNIGLKIKQLRRERNITQEELGELVGLTAKAISRYENSTSYPDITLLPILANIFEITVDELLDVDIYKKEHEIKEILEENHKYKHLGEVEKSIELLRNALLKYPNNYKIMEELSSSLHGFFYAQYPNRVDALDEMISLSEKILEKCIDDEIRHSAIQILVHGYTEKGELEKAKQLALKMPVFYCCRNVLLEDVLKDEELEKHVKRNIILITEWFQDEILVLSQNADEETNIKLRMKYIDLMKFVFESDNCGFYNERIYRAYFNIALSYAKLGDVENAIDNCIKCIESAILFEKYDKVKLNSLLLDGLVVDKNVTTSNMAISTYQRIYDWLSSKHFDIIKNNVRYVEIEKLLNQINNYCQLAKI